jgi:hypothetical protein
VHLTGYNPPRLPYRPTASVILHGIDFGTTPFFGTLNLIESTIEDNNTCAIWGPSGEAVIDRSTISGNSGESCGGVHVRSVEISNSTISGNTHLEDICHFQSTGGVEAAAMLISHSTIVGNAGVFGDVDLSYGLNQQVLLPGPCPACPPTSMCIPLAGEPVIVENSIIGSCVNSAGAAAPSGGGNVESPGDTCLFNDPTDQVNVSALDLDLDVLADNGGPTKTHALLRGSPAIDAIPVEECLDSEDMPLLTDQRGVQRPQGSACDIGAVEYVPEPTAIALQITALICIGLVALGRRGVLPPPLTAGPPVCRGADVGVRRSRGARGSILQRLYGGSFRTIVSSTEI